MTQDEIIEMARRVAGMITIHANGEATYSFYENQLRAFAKLVAEKEREECAIECEKIALSFTKWPSAFEGITAETKLMRSLGEFVHKPFTEAIRARGQA